MLVPHTLSCCCKNSSVGFGLIATDVVGKTGKYGEGDLQMCFMCFGVFAEFVDMNIKHKSKNTEQDPYPLRPGIVPAAVR